MAEDDPVLTSGAGDLPDVLEGLTVRARGLESGANAMARALTHAFTRAALDGRRLDDVLKGLALRLSNLAVRLALRPLEKGLAGGIDALIGAVSTAKPFADGGVIASPAYFPLGAGRLGLAGEAGPEAILPLARGADGRLGVAASGQGAPTQVSITIQTPDAASFRHSEVYVSGLIARAVARGQRGL